VSVTASAGTTGPSAYTTVNAALAAITLGTHQGAIVITIAANTTEPAYAAANQLVASGVGAASYQSVKIVPVGNVVVSSPATLTSGRGLLEFIGADSITIDGDDPLTTGTRNLTFQLSSVTTTYTSALRFSSSSSTSNGCRNVTVKNCLIIGSRASATATNVGFGITANGTSNAALSSVTTGAADNDNMRIENNEFRRCYYGFHAYGLSGFVMDSLVVKNNKFGNDVSSLNIGLYGIYLGNTAITANTGSPVIEGNEIQMGDYGTNGYAASIAAINLVASNAGATLRNNYIHNVNQPSTGGYGSYGIFVSNATNNNDISIYNNIIRDVKMYTYQGGSPNTWMPYGVYITVIVTGMKFNHNTIVMNQQLEGTTSYSSFCLATLTDMVFSEFNNNILVNNHNSSQGYLIYASSLLNFSTATMDHNNYKVAGSTFGYYSTNASSFAAWKTATTKDVNSMNVMPTFVSATNLRLQSGVKSPLESAGAVTSVTTDIDGNVRPGPAGSLNGGATAPDIGAHEADMFLDLFSSDSVRVTQIVQTIAPGDTSKGIMNVKVYVSGSLGTPIILNSLLLNTIGSTSPADIAMAKVFYTGTSGTFSANTLFGSTFSPSGSFAVTGSQLLGAGTHNFWVAYDISGGAISGHSVDVRLDSINIGSGYLVPLNGNPAGNVSILNPMTYVSSTVNQPITSKLGKSSINNQIIGIQVEMSASGAPAALTSFDLNLNGTTDTADIQNIKVWYTGNSSTFASGTQFGATVNYAPATSAPFALTITGSQSLNANTNYFWVTYDIRSGATVGNVVDAECTGLTVAGNAQFPTVTAPAGSRMIRAQYCDPPYTTGKTDGDLISNISISGTTLANNSGTLAVNPPYTYFSGAPNLTASFVQGGAYTVTVTVGTWGTQGIAAWIDYNDDGVFSASEKIGNTIGTIGTGTGGLPIPANHTASFGIQLSCASVPGVFRMRVRDAYNTSGVIMDPCATYGYGETEDYDVTILPLPVVYQYSTTVQQVDKVIQGTTNVPVLKIPIKTAGCGAGLSTEFRFKTTGSTSAASISKAKLYQSGNSTSFSLAHPVDSISSPSGNFSFIVNDTLVSNDTTNYWLVYDISPTATIGNVVDAVVDSIQVTGSWYIPAVTNPAGNIEIQSPMVFISSTAKQSLVTKIERGSPNNQILGIEVVMSPTGVPVSLTSLDLNLNGTTDTADIQNIKVWYTGNSKIFALSNQFGTTVDLAPATTAPFSFSVTGDRKLVNDTNYFWVTFDIKTGATLTNAVDAELTSLTVFGIPHTPAITAPAGNRLIAPDYCISAAINAFDGEILNVTVGALNNTSDCATAATGAGSALQLYGNYTNLPATNLVSGTTVPFSVNAATCGGNYPGMVGIWIDFNQNGTFTDPGEEVYMSPVSFTYSLTMFETGNFIMPCNVLLGETRMRVAMIQSSTPILPCGTYNYGETEDYTVNILPNPLTFNSVGTVQQTGVVAPGTTDVVITKIPVRVDGCAAAVLTEVRMSTTGTTNNADIMSAKLYRTSGTTFNTTTLLQTVFSPSGQFIFILNDTLTKNVDDNYWLAYDVNPGATFGNFLDAKLDSINVLGTYRVPLNGNPAGKVEINAPMSFVSATTLQNVTTKVEKGSTNNQIINVRVVMSTTGSSSNLTQLDLNLNGTTDTADIENIKVWYTGSSNTFATTTQVGTTIANAPATSSPFALTVTGNQVLNYGNNNFWVTFDIKAGAVVTHLVDAECTSVTVGAIAQTPAVTAPIGSREIMTPYCIPTITNGCGIDYVSQVTTIGATVDINNLTGCNGNTNGFIYYNSITPAAAIGGTFTIQLMAGGDTEGLGVWIDYNADGVFSATEFVFNAAPSLGVLQTGTITIPASAIAGTTRMRVRATYNNTPLDIDACLGVTYGETEDYSFTILPVPTPVAYVWNKTTASSYAVAANWTPVRTAKNLNDILVFNGGGSVTVNGAVSEMISKLVVTNNTRVTINTSATADITITDSLNLISGSLVTGTNITPIVGSSDTHIGVVTGSGRVEGNLSRWIPSVVTGTYNYPMGKGTDSRAISLNYTVPPTASGQLNIRYVQGAPGKNGLPLTDGALVLDSISKDGIWRLTSLGGFSGGTYDVTINANNLLGVTNIAGTAVVTRIGAASPWLASGVQVATTGTTTAMVLSRSGVTAYTEFGIAGTVANPLPVTLVQFTATAQGKDAALNWITASETNNSGFDVERSLDGRKFEQVTFVKGAGNSSRELTYGLTDLNAFSKGNVLYYRLRQVDNDGIATYSQVVRVSTAIQKANGISVHPNPFAATVDITLIASVDAVVQIEIADIQGRNINSVHANVIKGTNTVSIDHLDTLQPGVYFAKISIDGETQVVKLIKN
jgi:hypothetical protein